MRHFLSATALGVALGATLTVGSAPVTPAAAQVSEEEDRRRSRQTLQQRTGQQLNEALNLANEEPPRLQEALAEINDLLRRDLPPFDRSTVLEIRGSLNYQLENVAQALQDYTQVLQLDSLPSDRLIQIRRNVAQLHYSQENFQEAVRFMRDFIQQSPQEATANDYFILAGALIQLEDYQGAREPAETALRLDEKREKRYYDLLNLIYSELGLAAERGQLLEQMVEYFPEVESYWVQLSGSYSAADRIRDAFATLEAAYRAGIISDEPKIVALAQFYSELDNPYRGAQMLEQEMAAGNVERDLGNLKLLSQLWTQAREQDQAIEILTEAAGLADDGELYYQLGQSYLADEQFEQSIRALRQALNAGGLSADEQGNIYTLIGSAYFSLDSETPQGRQNAKDAFRQATRFRSSAPAAPDERAEPVRLPIGEIEIADEGNHRCRASSAFLCADRS